MEYMQTTDWNGYKKIEFTVGGRESYIVCPEKAAPGMPWVWRCEFFGAYNTADRALLKMGWHLAYHRVSNMYGCPEAVGMMHEFQTEACVRFGLSPKPVLFGFSRGGLYAVNYAVRYPFDVAALYLDAPVMDIRSWPCGRGGNAKCAAECLEIYGLTEETLAAFGGNPLDKAELLAAEQIPVMLVAGGSDETVPWEENGAKFVPRFRAAGGEIEVIVKPECGHHPHSLDDPRPITDFIAAHTDYAPALPNTLYRLTNNRKLTVAYFGGSITEGGGENGWRAKNTAWLRAQYPDAEITEVQAAIGGTGTSLGVFRCDRDVIAREPDLVYIEFAVNDRGDWQNTGRNTESILRKIYAANPYAEIVIVFTLTKAIADGMAGDEPYRSRDIQMRLARRYGLPVVNIGEALRREIESAHGGDWTALAPDTVHPNADGYIPCAAEMAAFMASALRGEAHRLHAVRLPMPLYESLRTDARLEDAACAHAEGFILVEESLCRRYPHYLEGGAGASLTLEFFGDTVGVYWMMAKDSGRIRWRIDGGEWSTRSAWDRYCLKFNRANSALLAADLEKKMHTLEIVVDSTHDEESEGCMIRIGAFLVN